jgi:hypothetical protein
MLWQKEGPRVKLVVWLPTTKVGNWLDLSVCRWSVIHHWKALEENYNFALDLIPIRGLSKTLWPCKVPGIQIRTVLRLLLGNLGTKRHLDVSAAERRREYYMGESGGFHQVWAVVSPVSPELLVVCPNTKGAQESDLTNLLVGLM